MDTVFRIIPEGIAIYDTEKDEVVLENPAFSERVLANAKLWDIDVSNNNGDQMKLRDLMKYQITEKTKWSVEVASTEKKFEMYSEQLDEGRLLHLLIDHTSIIKVSEIEAQKKYMNLMLASTSHEFRTPLNALMHGIKNIKQNSGANRETLRMMESSVQLLLSLMNDILDLVKIENGQFEIHESDFLLSDLLGRVGETFRYQVQGKGLKFEIITEFGSPEISDLRLRSDQMRLQQVLLNLISNSLKFTAKGSIEVIAKTIGRDLQFWVVDTGYGISSSDQQKLF